MAKSTRREFVKDFGKVAALGGLIHTSNIRLSGEDSSSTKILSRPPIKLGDLRRGWLDIGRTYRPHTRWWWPGAAVTNDGISSQLEQMREQGMGGVEIMVPWRMYTKGNSDYLSAEWLASVHHTIRKAAEMDMEVSITFGPGWSFGGFWVPPSQRSKVLTQGWVDVDGPRLFNDALPLYKAEISPVPELNESFRSNAPDENKIVAVVAGQLVEGRLDAASLIDITEHSNQDRMKWRVPQGRWRIMTFRLKYTGQQNQTTDNFPRKQWVIDHLNQNAVADYCEYLGGVFNKTFGEEFGKTVDSLFSDSFEIMCLPKTLLWSNDTLRQFSDYKGYDLKRYLPALWWDVGEMTPKIRYDVNDFLSSLGLKTVFKTFVGWCGQHNVQARMQPHYRFVEEIIQGAGATHRPETEFTTMGFQVIADPRKATVAGARFYGREIVSAEAYTFLHQERYQTTLEEMKIATDAFLRDGVTQFYNHGYTYSPESHVAPSRDMPWANRISHWNTWWKYYHCLSDYVSRCCFLLRQGDFVGDVLVYSPQSTIWAKTGLFENTRRCMPYGDLPKILVANGYDFDPVNDDVLQHRARVDDGCILIGNLSYRFLILPKTTVVPLKTMEFIRKFAMNGGIVIALDQLPLSSAGAIDWSHNDQLVHEWTEEIFGETGRHLPGEGHTYYIPSYKIIDTALNPGRQIPYSPTVPLIGGRAQLIAILRKHLMPDVVLDNFLESDGLTFIHRKLGVNDLYFITNLRPIQSEAIVRFRISNMVPEEWNPNTGETTPVLLYRSERDGVSVPVRLPPYASTFLLFRPGVPGLHLTTSNLDRILEVTSNHVEGLVGRNGPVQVTVMERGAVKNVKMDISDLPSPLEVEGLWNMILEGYNFPKFSTAISRLASWTENPRTAHFSGSAKYTLEFTIPHELLRNDIALTLDLGLVGNIAEVSLNQQPTGVAWMRPYQLDISNIARSGVNHLEITVTNTLINSVTGMAGLPGVPKYLVSHYGDTEGSYQLGVTAWERERKINPPTSGLVGPVRIIPQRKVKMQL